MVGLLQCRKLYVLVLVRGRCEDEVLLDFLCLDIDRGLVAAGVRLFCSLGDARPDTERVDVGFEPRISGVQSGCN